MVDIRKSSFSELFGVAFAVGLAFDVALIALGLVAAFFSPGTFHSGPPGATQVAAASPAQAIGILAMLSIVAIIVNLMVSSGGAGLLVIARSLGLFGKQKPKSSVTV